MYATEPGCVIVHLPLQAFEKSPPHDGRGIPGVSEETDQTVEHVLQDRLYCVRCQHPITYPAAALEMHGRHTHVCTNPLGETFEIRLFSLAACVRHGIATFEYTWFSGYAWQNAVCGNCMTQLGWVYSQNNVPAFYGLIANRLVSGHA